MIIAGVVAVRRRSSWLLSVRPLPRIGLITFLDGSILLGHGVLRVALKRAAFGGFVAGACGAAVARRGRIQYFLQQHQCVGFVLTLMTGVPISSEILLTDPGSAYNTGGHPALDSCLYRAGALQP